MMDPGAFVLIGRAPGIIPELLDVRSPPFFVITAWRLTQYPQSFVGGWVPVHVDIESFQGRFELGDVGFGCADLGVGGGPHELGNDGGGKNGEDHHHDHDLDKGEGASMTGR